MRLWGRGCSGRIPQSFREQRAWSVPFRRSPHFSMPLGQQQDTTSSELSHDECSIRQELLQLQQGSLKLRRLGVQFGVLDSWVLTCPWFWLLRWLLMWIATESSAFVQWTKLHVRTSSVWLMTLMTLQRRQRDMTDGWNESSHRRNRSLSPDPPHLLQQLGLE